VFLPPSQFEAAFIAIAHSEREIEKTVKAMKVALLHRSHNNYCHSADSVGPVHGYNQIKWT
jgi:hypothetical protein